MERREVPIGSPHKTHTCRCAASCEASSVAKERGKRVVAVDASRWPRAAFAGVTASDAERVTIVAHDAGPVAPVLTVVAGGHSKRLAGRAPALGGGGGSAADADAARRGTQRPRATEVATAISSLSGASPFPMLSLRVRVLVRAARVGCLDTGNWPYIFLSFPTAHLRPFRTRGVARAPVAIGRR